MQETQQQTVFGESIEQEYHIETTGRVIRPFKQLVTQVIKHRQPAEYRFHLTSDGIETYTVDPANVIMVNATLHDSALDTYDTENVDIGLSSDIFGGLLQHARYGVSTDDEIELYGNTNRMHSVVERDFSGVDATLAEDRALIDADSLREDADLDGVDEPEVECTLPTRAFIESVDCIDAGHIELSTEDGVTFQGEDDVSTSIVSLDVDASGDVESTLYSTDYMESIAKALHMGKVDDEITIKLNDDYPMFVEFEREDVYSGTICVSPRIQSRPEDR